MKLTGVPDVHIGVHTWIQWKENRISSMKSHFPDIIFATIMALGALLNIVLFHYTNKFKEGDSYVQSW